MSRDILNNDSLSPEALSAITGFHSDIVKEVKDAVSSNKVVVVGMAQNPVVSKARKALSEANVPYKYLEYGNYFSSWKRRLAIKLWSGWPTYPQVFVNGKLVGGYQETAQQIKEGKIKA